MCEDGRASFGHFKRVIIHICRPAFMLLEHMYYAWRRPFVLNADTIDGPKYVIKIEI
jgi:hypothetical protein